jgi:hypothetical protein
MSEEKLTLGECFDAVGNGHGVYSVGRVEAVCKFLSKEFGQRLPTERLPIRPMLTDRTASNPKYHRIMNPDSEGIWGMDSEELGPWICWMLDVAYVSKEGRGSNSQSCVIALYEELKRRNNDLKESDVS